MEHLYRAVGRERSLRALTQMLYFDVRSRGDGIVGAVHVTCADEAEAECAEAFQQGFVQYLLPPLKFARRSAMRASNLGGRYEWGAVGMAAMHFTLPDTGTPSTRLMVLKINAHVALEQVDNPVGERGFRLGVWKQYGRESPCCSSLDSLLRGGHEPWVEELREAFESEGKPRLAALNDPQAVDPTYRPLYAGIVSARLQARKAVLDIQELRPVTPIRFLVLACVTLNRHERDTEILCGIYSIDDSPDKAVVYFGLGDDPTAYRARVQNQQIEIADDELGTKRPGRNHRAMVRSEWQARRSGQRSMADDPRLERIREDVVRNKHRQHQHARALLRMALPILAEVTPVSAAVILFAEGAVGIHHAFRAHRLARELAGHEDARRILAEVHDQIDHMEPAKAEALIELLVRGPSTNGLATSCECELHRPREPRGGLRHRQPRRPDPAGGRRGRCMFLAVPLPPHLPDADGGDARRVHQTCPARAAPSTFCRTSPAPR